jgi:hypothetical protein
MTTAPAAPGQEIDMSRILKSFGRSPVKAFVPTRLRARAMTSCPQAPVPYAFNCPPNSGKTYGWRGDSSKPMYITSINRVVVGAGFQSSSPIDGTQLFGVLNFEPGTPVLERYIEGPVPADTGYEDKDLLDYIWDRETNRIICLVTFRLHLSGPNFQREHRLVFLDPVSGDVLQETVLSLPGPANNNNNAGGFFRLEGNGSLTIGLHVSGFIPLASFPHTFMLIDPSAMTVEVTRTITHPTDGFHVPATFQFTAAVFVCRKKAIYVPGFVSGDTDPSRHGFLILDSRTLATRQYIAKSWLGTGSPGGFASNVYIQSTDKIWMNDVFFDLDLNPVTGRNFAIRILNVDTLADESMINLLDIGEWAGPPVYNHQLDSYVFPIAYQPQTEEEEEDEDPLFPGIWIYNVHAPYAQHCAITHPSWPEVGGSTEYPFFLDYGEVPHSGVADISTFYVHDWNGDRDVIELVPSPI